MSNVRTLRAAFPGSDWKSSFVRALMRLVPDLNPDAADEISDSQFASARAMSPEVAAHHWALANTGKPSDESRQA